MYTMAEHEAFPMLANIVEPTVTFENLPSPATKYAEYSTDKEATQLPIWLLYSRNFLKIAAERKLNKYRIRKIRIGD
jgi:hypothetical protein